MPTGCACACACACAACAACASTCICCMSCRCWLRRCISRTVGRFHRLGLTCGRAAVNARCASIGAKPRELMR